MGSFPAQWNTGIDGSWAKVGLCSCACAQFVLTLYSTVSMDGFSCPTTFTPAEADSLSSVCDRLTPCFKDQSIGIKCSQSLVRKRMYPCPNGDAIETGATTPYTFMIALITVRPFPFLNVETEKSARAQVYNGTAFALPAQSSSCPFWPAAVV